MPFCPSCGKSVDANVIFCPNCGYNMQAGGQSATVPGGTPFMPTPMGRQRPTGVTALAILDFIGGILLVLGGILFMAVFSVAATNIATDYGGAVAAVGGVLGGVFLIIGLIALGLGYGLWNGKGWAWTATLIFEVLGVLGGLLALPYGLVGLVIDGLIIYYLTRAHVKQYFGK